MGYLFGVRFKMEANDLILALRQVSPSPLYPFCVLTSVRLGTVHPGLQLHRLAGTAQQRRFR